MPQVRLQGADGMKEIHLPEHAWPFFGPTVGFDWEKATWKQLVLRGLMFGGVALFTDPFPMIVGTTDQDIDADGPGGSTVIDSYWMPTTSLRHPNGNSIDSRLFPGLVVDSALIQLGARLGDFGLCAWGGRLIAFQIYDVGPTSKIGEGSDYLARKLGVVPFSQSAHVAATFGNNVLDVATLIFCGSGPGHALAPDLIPLAALSLYNRVATAGSSSPPAREFVHSYLTQLDARPARKRPELGAALA